MQAEIVCIGSYSAADIFCSQVCQAGKPCRCVKIWERGA